MPAARARARSARAARSSRPAPGGRIARLNGRTLRQLALTSDAAQPRALAVLGRTLIVADDKTLYAAPGRHPRAGRRLGLRPRAGARRRRKVPLVAATGHGSASSARPPSARACVRRSSRPGSERAPDGTILAVDGARGALATFRRTGKKLVARGSPIPRRASAPTDRSSSSGARLRAGLARPRRRRPRRAQGGLDDRPPGHPGAPALVGGTLVAPLPARGGVALSRARPGRRRRSSRPARSPTRPAAGTGSLAYVANAGDGTVTLVDVAKGKALAAPPGLGAARRRRREGGRPARYRRDRPATRHPDAAPRLGRARRAPGSSSRSRSIAKGAAVVELWQGGIASAIGRVDGPGLTATRASGAGPRGRPALGRGRRVHRDLGRAREGRPRRRRDADAEAGRPRPAAAVSWAAVAAVERWWRRRWRWWQQRNGRWRWRWRRWRRRRWRRRRRPRQLLSAQAMRRPPANCAA